MKKASFAIDGMSCQACAARIEKVLSKKESIEKNTSIITDQNKTSENMKQASSYIYQEEYNIHQI